MSCVRATTALELPSTRAEVYKEDLLLQFFRNSKTFYLDSPTAISQHTTPQLLLLYQHLSFLLHQSNLSDSAPNRISDSHIPQYSDLSHPRYNFHQE